MWAFVEMISCYPALLYLHCTVTHYMNFQSRLRFYFIPRCLHNHNACFVPFARNISQALLSENSIRVAMKNLNWSNFAPSKAERISTSVKPPSCGTVWDPCIAPPTCRSLAECSLWSRSATRSTPPGLRNHARTRVASAIEGKW